MDKKKIEEAIKYVYDNNPKREQERQVIAYRGCKSAPGMLVEWKQICSDPECYSCQNVLRLFQEEVQRQIKENETGQDLREV